MKSMCARCSRKKPPGSQRNDVSPLMFFSSEPTRLPFMVQVPTRRSRRLSAGSGCGSSGVVDTAVLLSSCAAAGLPLVEVVETDDADRRRSRATAEARGDLGPDADLAPGRPQHDGDEQRDDRLEEHRDVERPNDVRQWRTPDGSGTYLPDDGGDCHRRAENDERDAARRLRDRLARDELCQLRD